MHYACATIAAAQMCLTPYCNEKEFEEMVKTKSKAEAVAAGGGCARSSLALRRDQCGIHRA
jgi:hypothetical protein